MSPEYQINVTIFFRKFITLISLKVPTGMSDLISRFYFPFVSLGKNAASSVSTTGMKNPSSSLLRGYLFTQNTKNHPKLDLPRWTRKKVKKKSFKTSFRRQVIEHNEFLLFFLRQKVRLYQVDILGFWNCYCYFKIKIIYHYYCANFTLKPCLHAAGLPTVLVLVIISSCYYLF